MWAAVAALVFGSTNYIMADLSAELDIKVNYLQAIPFYLATSLFHFVKSLQHRSKGAGVPYFCKENSSYFKLNQDGTYQLCKTRVMLPLVRALFQIAISLFITLCFYFAAKSNVNSGIIASNFSSCLIFTGLIFQWRYN